MDAPDVDAPDVDAPPALPGWIFGPDGPLPDPLRRACVSFESEAQRDLFLLGWLPVAAAAMPHVLTRYNRAWKALVVNAVVVALAAAGKSAFARAAACGTPLDDRLTEASRAARKAWKGLDADERDRTPEPPRSRLFVGADASMRAMGDALVDNDGRALVFDTEIAELARTLKADWGNFTTLMLKSYEQEPYSRDRKGEEPVHVARPALSVGLTGTPRSFVQLVPDEESGLFSRLLVYTFAGDAGWSDQFGEFDDPLDGVVAGIGRDLDRIHADLSARPSAAPGGAAPGGAAPGGDTGLVVSSGAGGPGVRPLYLQLTRAQQRTVNENMARVLADALVDGRDELAANVKRGALGAVRIAGLLAVYRLRLSGADLARAVSVEPTDAEVEGALDVVVTCLSHASRLALRFAADPALKITDEGRRALFSQLPAEFSTADAVALGADAGMSRPSAERALADFVARGLVRRLRQGHYAKGAAPTTAGPTTPTEAGADPYRDGDDPF